MPTYVLLLRGINVSGHNKLKMKDLQACLETLGLSAIQTYLQSGNAVFNAPKQAPETLAPKIQQALHAAHGITVRALVKTAAELRSIRAANPFLDEPDVDVATLHVTFLRGVPARAAVEGMARIDAGRDRYRHVGSAIYLSCPDGYAKTKLSNKGLEKWLAVDATTRNWKTVSALVAMLETSKQAG